ncbi:hypothetical protein [Phenylobacterium sp.]|uniref:hypothetical protein n=1 Tax=Phenylobacterium sp. TaxID=1871053 RepID=UPI003568C591
MRTATRRGVLAGAAALAVAPAALAAKLPIAPLEASRDGVTLSTRDLGPRFLDFYRAAQGASPDARFAIWQDRYGFAATPPTPQGDAMARKLLDEAWPRYAAALPVIEAGAAAMRPAPLDVAVRIAELLQAPRPLKVGVIAYVGAFETNAFTNSTPDGPVVAVPIEMTPEVRSLILPHEMTHAMHILVGHLSSGYERSLARVVFEEGLAMRTTQRLVPGRPDYAYVGEQDWFAKGLARRTAIARAIAPLSDRKDGETLFKFTMGKGPNGLEREAYIAGWLVVGRMLEKGATLPELARIPEAEMPARVGAALKEIVG